jgi:integrase
MGKLTVVEVRGLRTKGKYLDGHGLILNVVAPDQRYWMFRYRRDGRERTMSLGDAELIGLVTARQRHQEARARLACGIDPLAERQAAKAASQARQTACSFAQAAEAYIVAHKAAWRGRSEEHWRQSLTDHAFPVFGAKPVGEVTTEDVLAALTPIWTAKPVTAVIVRSRIELVLSYAKSRGWRSGENAARWRDHLANLLARPAKVHRVAHRPALPWAEVPAFMARLAAESSMAGKALAFCILTAARSGEACGARWAEIDVGTATWTIPAERTKTGREHRVALSDPALAILSGMAALRVDDWVFPGSKRGRPVTGTTLRVLLTKLVPGVTVHGFRSTFRDWAADRGTPFEVAEAALAHVTGNAVVQAYQRSDLLDARRRLMREWGEFLTRPPAEVVPLRAAG